MKTTEWTALINVALNKCDPSDTEEMLNEMNAAISDAFTDREYDRIGEGDYPENWHRMVAAFYSLFPGPDDTRKHYDVFTCEGSQRTVEWIDVPREALLAARDEIVVDGKVMK